MDIDFVILWVDENDPVWKQAFEKYSTGCAGDNSLKRYRNWNNFHYLFRAFENFTPWVRTIHLVTCGHLPEWLNKDHPKLNIVNHNDFLNQAHLPVFNCNPIEINLHRISSLSEHFVFFNDDTFILKEISPDRFFKNKLPCDMLAFTSILMTHLAHIRLNDLLIINKHFTKKTILKKLFFKWFNFRYGPHLLKSLFLLPWPQITGIVDPHQAQPYLKSTFIELWEKESKVLNQTSMARFRNDSDVNQYLFRYWQLLSGKFKPVSFSDSLCIQVEDLKDARIAANQILKDKYALFCVNDLLEETDPSTFKKAASIINHAFETILPEKSNFEK